MIETTSRTAPTFFARLKDLWRSNRDAYIVRIRTNATVRRLNSMTDRELSDIGVSRYNIYDVAEDAARRG
ncbi:DUF1127 domain-containing protein [Shimia haliotis]|uniref:YjiS-like domain-containing protein n=1 Tax=Shimia haliotis TaxID=1280847 RepID=A0A1I4H6J6_9RHOB|nr:DUF1127 domain-containing protein [Shimia haliotis]SFL37237.1 protein of unknown function [Shimia haliotis]